MKLIKNILLTTATGLAFAFLGVSGMAFAQDLSDPETCMECHADQERGGPSNPDIPQVHNPDGGFFVEAHEMWSCTDCHTYIVEIPHADEVVEMEVDCTECHDEVPSN